MGALGPNGVFIVAAYASVVIVLMGLIVWIVADARRQERALAELEAKGVTRRSERKRTPSGKGRRA